MINNKLIRYKITLNKPNLSVSNQQILNSFFEVSNNDSNKKTSNLPFHFEFKQNKLSFIILSPNDIQEINNHCNNNNNNNNSNNNNSIVELDKKLKQFNQYNQLNKNEGFIIIESLIGNTVTFGTNKINNNDTINNNNSLYGNSKIKEFNKFQMNYLFYNFKFLFSSSQTETFEIMIKCLEESNQPSILKSPKSIIDSLFLKNEKIKLLNSIDNLKISDCQFLLTGDKEISNIFQIIEKENNKFINAITTINSNNRSEDVGGGSGEEIDKSILSVYKFLQSDSRI
ncbi:hypothetical protein ACTFIR_001400 [Dictyostelium discoideum]